jgi:PPOX class probable F420-dependent enzyme
MANRRSQIALTPAEVDELLRIGRPVMSVATNGPDGHPHVVAMWFHLLALPGEAAKPVFWTFAKSQKVMNLRRDPRLTALVEDGEAYQELRGVELVGRGRIIDDPATVLEIGTLVIGRYQGPEAVSGAARPYIEAQAAKRVGVVIDVDRVVSWDHRKLAGPA